MIDYAARNAMLPNLSGFAMSLGFVISGAILVEYVFNYPGLGYLLYNAVQNTDYPLMQALFMLFTVAVLVALLLCDFAIAWLDPRARAKGVSAMTALLVDRRGSRDRRSPTPAARRRPVARRAAQPQGDGRPASFPGLLRVRRRAAAVHLGRPTPTQLAFTPRCRRPSTHWLGTTSLGPGHLGPAGLRHPPVAGHRPGRRVLRHVLSVLVGVSAAYLGGIADDMLSMITNVFLVHPDLPADHHPGHLRRQGHADGRADRAGRHRLVLRREPAARAGAVAAQPRLPGIRAGTRRAPLVHHRRSRCCRR